MDIRALLVIAVILVIGFAIGASLTGLASMGGPTSDGNWLCLQVDPNTCTNYATKDEWINNNCATTEDGVMCQVITDDGQTGIMALSDLEDQGALPDQICVQYACAIEVWGRLLI
ncbi:unnamed protein product [marine sediment metagenome]|uniref:Uncharacterized protein n=1 Tax=marine sediment metagenome TaxID=412755 RepID=X1SVY8_9ZZZZ